MIGQGRGFLVAVAAFACLLAAESATEAWFADTAFYRKHGWPKAAGLALAAVIVWLLRGLLGAGRTGEKRRAGHAGSLFFVPARSWPAILAAGAVVALLV